MTDGNTRRLLKLMALRYFLHTKCTEEELNWLAGEVETLQALTKASCEKKLAELASSASSSSNGNDTKVS